VKVGRVAGRLGWVLVVGSFYESRVECEVRWAPPQKIGCSLGSTCRDPEIFPIFEQAVAVFRPLVLVRYIPHCSALGNAFWGRELLS
jgi:hypothetical protein